MTKIIADSFWQTGQSFLVVARKENFAEIANEAREYFNVSKFDVTEIGKDEPVVVASVREMRRVAFTLPSQGKSRLAIIFNFDQTNAESANTLLKILEETPKQTCFLLLAETFNILPTIISRCSVYALQTRSNQAEPLIPLALRQNFATVSLKIREYVDQGLAAKLVDSWCEEIMQNDQPNFNQLRWLIEIRAIITSSSVNTTAILEATYLNITQNIALPKSTDFK